ncbi:hypothetical protein Bca4012_079920 [Brassica carinata]
MDTKGNSSYRHFFSNGGQCDVASKIMTSILVAICGFSCFILSFTDSYKDKNGTICYGLATTLHGFWIIDDRQRFLKSYLKNIKNAVNCFFFSALSGEALEILTALPVGVDQDSFF